MLGGESCIKNVYKLIGAQPQHYLSQASVNSMSELFCSVTNNLALKEINTLNKKFDKKLMPYPRGGGNNLDGLSSADQSHITDGMVLFGMFLELRPVNSRVGYLSFPPFFARNFRGFF